MIKFAGVLSDKCVLYRKKWSLRCVIICEAVATVVFVPLLVILCVLFGGNVKGVIPLAVLMIFVIIVLVIQYFTTGTTGRPLIKLYVELFVDSEFVEYTANNKTEKIPMNKIKKVVKIGQSYYIIRKSGDMSISFMTEEPLIIEGTIEEFESLFAGKIEVRTK